MASSQSQHILELSRELLDDIELSRLSSDKLLLKCSRLARLAGTDEEQYWISLELGGYNSSNPISLKYMSLTNRWIDRKENKGFWGPLAQQEVSLEAQKTQLASTNIPNLSGEYLNIAITNVMNVKNKLSSNITTYSGIISRVLNLLHGFVSRIYYEREFSSLAETIFEAYKRDIDALIATSAGEVLSKIPSVIDRLSQGDEESISQALNTCRRIIDTFADTVFPPTDGTIEIGGNTLKLDASKPLNRINAFVSGKCSSTSRKTKIRQNLSNLYDRVSTGVHKEVDADEAFSLFLNTYLLLGEILKMKEQS